MTRLSLRPHLSLSFRMVIDAAFIFVRVSIKSRNIVCAASHFVYSIRKASFYVTIVLLRLTVYLSDVRATQSRLLGTSISTKGTSGSLSFISLSIMHVIKAVSLYVWLDVSVLCTLLNYPANPIWTYRPSHPNRTCISYITQRIINFL